MWRCSQIRILSAPYARRYALFTLVGIAGEDDLSDADIFANSGVANNSYWRRWSKISRLVEGAIRRRRTGADWRHKWPWAPRFSRRRRTGPADG